MNKRVTIFLYSASLFLLSCSEEKAETVKTVQLQLNTQPVFSSYEDKPGDLFGTWEDNFTFYSSQLKIEKNGTFEFYEQGCLGIHATKGRWFQYGQELFFNSYAGDKNTAAHDDQIVYTVRPIKRKNRDEKWMRKEIRYLEPDFTAEIIRPASPSDTTRIYFDQEKFILSDGVLYRNNISESSRYKKMRSGL